MKKRTFLFITITVWLLTILSLIAVRYQFRRPPEVAGISREAKAYYDALDMSIKRNISYFETAIIRLSDGGFKPIGVGFEPELETLLLEHRLKSRRIDFFVSDPVALERRMMAGEAFKTLNNAEKKCFVNGFGVVIFRNGSYQFICDDAIYQDYVKKFGTECIPCKELKELHSSNGGGIDE